MLPRTFTINAPTSHLSRRRAGFALLAWLASGAAFAGGVPTVAGMPPVTDPANLYGDAGANMLSPVVAGALPRV